MNPVWVVLAALVMVAGVVMAVGWWRLTGDWMRCVPALVSGLGAALSLIAIGLSR